MAGGSGATLKDALVDGCDDPDANGVFSERIRAAAAIDNYISYLTQSSTNRTCGAQNCVDTVLGVPVVGGDHSCNTSTELDNLKTCLNATKSQATGATCANGKRCSSGGHGSSRADGILGAIFDLLDADDSVSSINCQDTGGIYSGTVNQTITCGQFLYTPFRNLQGIPDGTGSNSTLPVVGAGANKLKDHLTAADADILNIRFRPMAIGGDDTSLNTTVDTCTGNNFFHIPNGGFRGASQQQVQNTWDFYKSKIAGGRTSLAGVLGIDDLHTSSNDNYVTQDALNAYEGEIKTDAACSCRQEFVVLITDLI